MTKRIARLAAAVVVLPALSAFADAPTSNPPPGEREVLPAEISPASYDLSLFPDADKLTFHGTVVIHVEAKKQASSVVLNADKLTLDRAVLDNGAAATFSLDSALQRATLTFPTPVGPGSHTLMIDYHGKIGTATLGFFAMDYESPDGKRRTLATNFEPASERQFMPSWDEPAQKATFTLSVVIPGGLTAVSNMPVSATEDLPGGLKRVRFQTSPRMSTYLFFLGIGDFERISTQIDGVDLGVVVSKGSTSRGQYALSEAAKILHYYNDYFGYRFPLPKLDLIASPGKISGGSMENWGAIFYSQDHLLFDPALSTEEDRHDVFQVVAHEMSHQWFGDLVTMAWWDNLWLNEGFASWMETKIADDLHPEWEWGLRSTRIENGKFEDAKPSTHPILREVITASQAEQSFDGITYGKGSAVVGMLEDFVGAETFRDGVRRYMQLHAFGNTVDGDFWQAIEAASGKPVIQIETGFTTQPGLPLLQVLSEEPMQGGTRVNIATSRFAEDPATLVGIPVSSWHVPVTVMAGQAITKQIIEGTKGTAVVAGAYPALVNAGQKTYARVFYPPAVFEALLPGVSALQPVDQLGLLNDAWALGRAGYEPMTDYLALTRALRSDGNPFVWSKVAVALKEIDRLYGGYPGRARFREFALARLRPLATNLGWQPKNGEGINVPALRSALLRALSGFDDPAVIDEARRLYEKGSFASASDRKTVIEVVSEHADAPMLDRLIGEIRALKDPLERQDRFEALMALKDPALIGRVLDLAISDEAPAGSAIQSLLPIAARNHPDMVWDFAVKHVDQPGFPMDSESRLWLMPNLASRSLNPARAKELEQYADAHIPAGAREHVESAITTLQQTERFRKVRLPEIDSWLASLGPG
jgi:aminopeptidase N